jgi:hypothetical protein
MLLAVRNSPYFPMGSSLKRRVKIDFGLEVDIQYLKFRKTCSIEQMGPL